MRWSSAITCFDRRRTVDNAMLWLMTILLVVALGGPAARRVLAGLMERHPEMVDAATVDRAGKMVAIEPKAFQGHEGADIGDQEQIVRLHRSHKPVLSQAFRAVEGFDALDLEWPVFGAGGELMGSVSLSSRPESFLDGIVKPVVAGFPVEVWVMQPDGRILYDPEPEEAGRNLLRDPLYQAAGDLPRVARRIAAAQAGSASFGYPAAAPGKPRREIAYWATAGLHGTDWRVVMTRPAPGETGAPDRRLAELQQLASDAALRRLAGAASLRRELAAGEKEKVLARFHRFVEANPGVYSIQWVDAASVSRFGYPAANSLGNFDFHAGRAPGDDRFLAALNAGRPASFDLPLVEGKHGRFYLYPAGRGLGMLYTIRLVP